jgi:NAD(P)-dependent dehydrogenase (short-subunit alcohol dehydrogenase family)
MKRSRHALVTGASSGIGLAIVRRLLDDGWRVTGVSRRVPALSGKRYAHLSVDLLATGEIAAAFAGLTCDAFVHAAGLLRFGPLGRVGLADGEIMWRTHVMAAVAITDCLVERMPRGGRIVLIGSRLSHGAADRSQYAATKGALVSLARSWAKELVAQGITVNVVAPGATSTPLLANPERKKNPPQLPPIGRFVRTTEVAALTAFLLSKEAAAITGQEIIMCGGSSL